MGGVTSLDASARELVEEDHRRAPRRCIGEARGSEKAARHARVSARTIGARPALQPQKGRPR